MPKSPPPFPVLPYHHLHAVAALTPLPARRAAALRAHRRLCAAATTTAFTPAPEYLAALDDLALAADDMPCAAAARRADAHRADAHDTAQKRASNLEPGTPAYRAAWARFWLAASVAAHLRHPEDPQGGGWMELIHATAHLGVAERVVWDEIFAATDEYRLLR